MRTTPFRILFFAVLVILLASCAGLTTKPDSTPRSPLEIAELTYVQGAVFYTAAKEQVVSLRAQRIITDAQWVRFDAAQAIVEKYAPVVAGGLKTWRATGHKPAAIDGAAAQMSHATTELAALLAEVTR